MSLYIAIILYILSLIIGLFLVATVKSVSTRIFLTVFSVHALFLFLFLLAKFVTQKNETEDHFTFLLFICTGVILAGLAWKSSIHLFFKIYCSLFFLTIPLFFFSPSRLMVFLLTSQYTGTIGKSFHVQENYFLEQQHATSATTAYKLVRKHGLFHETIQRNISFNGVLDSVHILGFDSMKNASIRGYTSKVTFVSSENDSVDVTLKLEKEKTNNIERRF